MTFAPARLSVALVLGTLISAGALGCAAGQIGTDDSARGRPADNGGDPGGTTSGTHGGATDAGTGGTDTGTGNTTGGGATDAGSTTTTSGGSDGGTTPPPPTGSLAKNISIDEVALFQGVKVSLEKAGSKQSRSTNVVANREGLLRIYVTPGAGFSGSVTGELRISKGGAAPTLYTGTLTPSGASSDGSLGSTINISVPTDALSVDAQWSVRLTQASPSGADTGRAEYPAGGATEALGAVDTGASIKVKVVPVRYNADGSGRLPDTSAAQIEAYRQSMYQKYPARSIEISVRAPWDYNGTVSADGTGWSEILQATTTLRQNDGAPGDVYYYAAFDAASSFDQFCGGGCVTGLCSLVTNAADDTMRACVGIGFTGSESAKTIAHEVGHAHGRQHAPCGPVSGADPAFPYSGGGIGSWGYDVIGKSLINPSGTSDMMGYCDTVWISDYNFEALLQRAAYVAKSPNWLFADAPVPQTYRFVDVAADGSLKWGSQVTLKRPPTGESRTVSVVSADGTKTTIAGAYYPHDHLGGGLLLVPEPHMSVLEASVQGFGGVLAPLSKR